MIKLYQLTGYWNIPSPSPFCMKLETYLRMAKIPFKSMNVLDPLSAPQNRMAPKKKIPFAEIDGELVGDSSFIINILKSQYGDRVDHFLNKKQLAYGLAIQRLFEDHYFWSMVYSRWFDDAGWAVTNPEFFGGLNWPLRNLVPKQRKKRMKKVLYSHGVGRNTQAEIYSSAKHDLDAFAALLGSKNFIFGEKPSSFDAVAHGFLVNTLRVPFNYELKQHASQYKSFLEYCERIDKLYYPEYAGATQVTEVIA